VAEAIARHRAGLDADTERYVARLGAEGEAAVREAAAEYLGTGRPSEIALTDSTTMGLGLLYAGIRVRPDQHVLTTEHEFFSTHQAWSLRSAREGVIVRRVQMYDDPAAASADEMASRLVDAVTPATRVVAVTWVHSGTGVKIPVREIARGLARANAGRAPEDRALLCVDGVHGFGVEDTTVTDLGCDFLVSGTHKWLFGPRGTGIVWGRWDAWQEVDATIPAFEPQSFSEWFSGQPPEPSTGIRFTPGGYHTFEHRWAVAEAFRFHLDIGKDRIAARTRDQASRLKNGLAELPGVNVVTPMSPELSAGIVCVDVAGQPLPDVLGRLADAGIVATVTPYREQYIRLGPSIVTTPEDVDAVIEALTP
jgi:selenocysteine lyase/cysteine desulfurase